MVFLRCLLVEGRVVPEGEQAVNLRAGVIQETRSCAGVGTQKALC